MNRDQGHQLPHLQPAYSASVWVNSQIDINPIVLPRPAVDWSKRRSRFNSLLKSKQISYYLYSIKYGLFLYLHDYGKLMQQIKWRSSIFNTSTSTISN